MIPRVGSKRTTTRGWLELGCDLTHGQISPLVGSNLRQLVSTSDIPEVVEGDSSTLCGEEEEATRRYCVGPDQ